MDAPNTVSRRANQSRNATGPHAMNDKALATKRKTELILIGSTLACGATLGPSAHAGGIVRCETATPNVGLASAGYAARAQDASTVFGNPAGMSLMLAASFKATDWLSIGAGLNAMYGYLNSEVGIRTGAPGDGQLKLKDEPQKQK